MNYGEIIALIDSKDRKGWEVLYLMYGEKFYGFAVDNWGFTEDQAWDIVYQTLETTILKIGEYEIQSQTHFDNLLFKIFTNFLRQQYRKNKTYSQNFKVVYFGEMNIGDNDDSSELNNPFTKEFFEDYMESEEAENPKLKELQTALSKLEPVERDLLLLKANNFTYEQIADMLKIENNQLKVKHHRAKRKLIKFLQPI